MREPSAKAGGIGIAVRGLKMTTDQLADLESATDMTQPVLLSHAIRRLHRIYLVDAPRLAPSRGSCSLSCIAACRGRSVTSSHTRFELREPFRYQEESSVIDMASVPPFSNG